MARLILSLLLACGLGAQWCLGAGPSLALSQPPATPPPPAPRSKVFFVSDPALMIGYHPNTLAIEAVTDALVVAATGQKSLTAAWRSLVSPGDHIGIKIDAAGGREFSTHVAIVEAVLHGLAAAGIPSSQIVIWDRQNPRDAGYTVGSSGPSLRSIEPFYGYEPKAIMTIPNVGKLIWGDVGFHPRGPDPLAPIQRDQFSIDSHWSRLICGLNKIINIPVMSASEDCGISGCIYNVTIPNIDNWRRFLNPPECGDPYLCELYSDEHAGPKVVLNIMDGLIAQYGGGPEWQPDYSWSHDTLYASKDPVAVDATALRILESCRHLAKLPSIMDEAKYLRTAASMGLGNYDENQIDLVRIDR